LGNALIVNNNVPRQAMLHKHHKSLRKALQDAVSFAGRHGALRQFVQLPIRGFGGVGRQGKSEEEKL
jgi:hypothetical protein